jgi:sterol 3beta-glucosyltransferase/vancomycin aglycone glucosyltransferase
MKIGLQTWGSNGDIRPFCALAHGLRQAGHEVGLIITDIAGTDHSALAARLGINATHVGMPVVKSRADVDRIGEACISAADPLKQARIIMDRLFYPALEAMSEASIDLCRGHDAVIRHFFLYPLQIAARQSDVPEISVMLAHNTIPTRHQPPAGLPDLGPLINPWTWRLVSRVLNSRLLPRINRSYRYAGLPPAGDLLREVWSSPLLNLVAVSPAIARAPEDWPSQHRVCGFLDVPGPPPDSALPPALNDFLGAGPAPAFVTFGSLTPSAPERVDALVKMFRRALRKAAVRGIIQIPANGAEQSPRDDEVFYCREIDHARVFPQCALVVHHGGAGTTHSTLRAGVPSVVVPHVSDQFFWASELRLLGAAPAMLPVRTLTADRLARGIEAIMSEPSYHANARRIQAAMAEEHGVARAVDAVHAALSSGGTDPIGRSSTLP